MFLKFPRDEREMSTPEPLKTENSLISTTVNDEAGNVVPGIFSRTTNFYSTPDNQRRGQ